MDRSLFSSIVYTKVKEKTLGSGIRNQCVLYGSSCETGPGEFHKKPCSRCHFCFKKYNSFIFKSKFESLKENVDKTDFSFSVLRQSLHFKDDAVSIVSKNLELRKP